MKSLLKALWLNLSAHVFFSAAKTEDFKKAFTEYVGKGQSKSQKRGEFTREQMQKQAQKAAGNPRRQKQRENKGEQKMRVSDNFKTVPVPKARADDLSTAIFDADTDRKGKSARCRWISLLRTEKIKILKKPIKQAFSGKGANLYVTLGSVTI